MKKIAHNMENNNTSTTASGEVVYNKKAEEYQSLYEFRGYAASKRGDGKQVYEEAKRRGIEVKTQEVDVPTYKGSVMRYPKSFLQDFFNKPAEEPKKWHTEIGKDIRQPAIHDALRTVWWAKVNKLMPMDIVLNVLNKLDLRTDAWTITEQGYTFYSKDGKTTHKYGK
jgi:hypothetical protein